MIYHQGLSPERHAGSDHAVGPGDGRVHRVAFSPGWPLPDFTADIPAEARVQFRFEMRGTGKAMQRTPRSRTR